VFRKLYGNFYEEFGLDCQYFQRLLLNLGSSWPSIPTSSLLTGEEVTNQPQHRPSSTNNLSAVDQSVQPIHPDVSLPNGLPYYALHMAYLWPRLCCQQDGRVRKLYSWCSGSRHSFPPMMAGTCPAPSQQLDSASPDVQ